jgi:hypothetical protein
MQLDLRTGLQEHSLSAQSVANLLFLTEDNATALDAILTSKKSIINSILLASTTVKCKQDNLIWSEHQRARALQHALMESNQTASDTAGECTQLNMLLQQQWEEKVHFEKLVNLLLYCFVLFLRDSDWLTLGSASSCIFR